MIATQADTSDTETLAEWLGARTDAELVELLRIRPDLTVPVPQSMQVLAGRVEQRASVQRCADELDTVVLSVIETLALIGADKLAVPVTRLRNAMSGRASKAVVDEALAALRVRALVWGSRSLCLVSAAVDAVPWLVGRAEQRAEMNEEDILAALVGISRAERVLLERLAVTAPIGRTRDAAPGTPADRPVQRLLSVGMLRWIDDQTVELPHEVGQVLRGEAITDPGSLAAPPTEPVRLSGAEVNGVVAGEALELLRHSADLIAALGDAPAAALKAGGMGVRELRRLARATGVDEDRVALVVELLVAAGLLAAGVPDDRLPADPGDEFWVPTVQVEAWLEAPPERRWAALAGAWLDLPRRPWLIGLRDATDKPIAALSDELRSALAPRDRRKVLGVLADAGRETGIAPGRVARLLAWQRPRLAGRFSQEMVTRTLAEAAALGVVGRDALGDPGRALLAGEDAEAAMRVALPAPVDYVLLQNDLTIVAPGPLTPDLQHSISLVADLESAGGAAVYRVGDASVRRALDAGMTAAELHALFETHSRTPVPQSLTYLVDDVARRHGRLRAGVAQAFLRCDDPALLAEVLASSAAEELALRALAPTVAIAQAPLRDVLEKLRAAGFAPAGENSAGAIVDLRPRGARISTRRPRPQLRAPLPPNNEQLERIVSDVRANDRAVAVAEEHAANLSGPRASGQATMPLLQLAVRGRRSVSIGYVDAAGTASQRIVEPVKIGGGQLDAFDPVSGSIRHFSLHRISSVTLVE